jgi:hypothetical protein
MVWSNATNEDDNNTTHAYFINVLERVLQILRPCSSTPEEQSRSGGISSRMSEEEIIKVAGNFGILSIEEGELEQVNSDATLKSTLPTSSRPSVSKNVPFEYEIEVGIGNEEIYFAIFCLFTDLQAIRKFLLDLWRDYQSGQTDLVAASLTTNLAFDLVRRAEKDFSEEFPMFKSYMDIWLYIYPVLCSQRGIDPIRQKSELIPPEMRDIADFLYMNTFISLGRFCDIIKPGQHVIYRPGGYGDYDPEVDRAQLDYAKRLQVDRIIVSEAFPEFLILGDDRLNLPIIDNFSDGLIEMSETKTIPLWLTFATQIYLDIHHALRANVKRPLTEMRATGIRTLISIQQYRSSPGPRTYELWPQTNEDYVTHMAIFIDNWAKRDALRETRDTIFRQLPPPDSGDQPFALLTRHPMLCGLLQFKIYSDFKDAGSALAGAWGVVLYVAHLYNACRQGGYLEDVWMDMELLMDVHGRDSFFAGKVPKTPEEWEKCMMLMLGTAPESYARGGRRGRRDRGLHHSKKGPKGFTATSATPVSDSFQSNSDHPTLSVENVHVILNTQMYQSRVSEASKSKAPQGQQSSERQGVLKSQWSKSHKLSPLQLLESLRPALETEEPALRFDYFSMHVRCFQILRQVRDEIDQDLRNYFGDKYIENDTQLPTVVSWIFRVVAGNATNVQLNRALRGLDVGSAMMAKAASVLKKVIDREGRVESEKIGKICVHWQERAESGDDEEVILV